MVNGTELFLDEAGRQMGGRKVELIVEDDEGNPATALNKTRKAFEAKAGKIASCYSEACDTNARWIGEAVKAIGGRVEDRDAFLAALRKVDLKDTARGAISIDRWGNPVQNIYIRKVERVAGKLQNTVVATIPAVGQFWKYNPDEYLKLPLYSRDYPPCKHC